MRVGIMQPYFFPYLGYFALIERCDKWVVFDVTQYTPKTWMNRNRVLHPTESWNWVTVPLANSSNSIRIHEAKVLDADKARASALGKLSHYRNRAPHWRTVKGLLEAAFDGAADASLVTLNASALRVVCSYLGIGFEPVICSELGLDLTAVDHPGGWAPVVAGALGADEYLNPVGGLQLFSQEEFNERGIALEFLEFPSFEYVTSGYAFVPNLSVLDVLMWNDVESVRSALAAAAIKQGSELLPS
ncbi:MAG: WbqC family protein [Solirubrobacteraceae bacterium]